MSATSNKANETLLSACRARRRVQYVDFPNEPEIEKYYVTDRPGIVYVNRSGIKGGFCKVLPPARRL